MEFYTKMLILISPLVATVFFVLFFFRSTKGYPKSWRELKIELHTIYVGLYGTVEDLLLFYRNKIELIPFPTNKICVITGGNRGIGIEVVKKLLKCNVSVVMGVRDPESSKQIVSNFIGPKDSNRVFYEKCDTGDMNSVREFAKKIQQQFPEIHILINNAGIMSTPYKETKDGFESQMAVNHMGHFLLTHLLMPQLIAGIESNDGKNVRIVNVSSCVHEVSDEFDYEDFHLKKWYFPVHAYARSKLAQVYSTKYLDKYLRDKGLKVQVNSVHPGIVDTGIFEHASSSYVPWVKRLYYKRPEAGARTIVYAAISNSIENQGGKYLSNCEFVNPHKGSRDISQTKKLFEYSCNLLKIVSFGDL